MAMESERQIGHLGSGKPLTYSGYLRVPELIALQSCQSDPPHHDETLFIIIHQAYELWFKQMLHELDTVLGLLADAAAAGPAPGWEPRVRRATFLMRRVVAIQALLVEQIHILETMAPKDFLGFRSYLNPASGFQSGQFREIEIVGGLRDPRLLTHFRNEPQVAARLAWRFERPSLPGLYYALLEAHGFRLPQPPPDADEDTVTRVEDARLEALAPLFDDLEHYLTLRELAEVLLDFDERLSLWRTHHLQMVERMIGAKRGTGGSEGVGYLRTTLLKRCFPDLWKVRTHLSGPARL
jgi:tryptophan 2,3-dioxygenase